MPTAATTEATATPAGPTLRFDPPGPGSWVLDASHCERPHSRYIAGWFPDRYTEGFRAGMAACGALLDTIEMKFVNGFAYMAVRPLGAPPEARSAPPKLIFKLVTRVHPALRRRIRRAAQVLDERPWRAEIDRFVATKAERERGLLALQRTPIEDLPVAGLLDHLDRCRERLEHDMFEHFRLAPYTLIPVGDFIAHAIEWTGCGEREALAALRGASPDSLDGIADLAAAAAAIRGDDDARATLEGAGPAAEILASLSARPDAIGASVEHWLERVGQRIVTGHDVAELRAIELPDGLVSALRMQVEEAGAGAQADGGGATALRDRVPEPNRDAFDALLEEARHAYVLRDARSVNDVWSMGLLRRALLETGRRLADAGALHTADHVVGLEHGEIHALLTGGPGPGPDQVAAWCAVRDRLTSDDAPVLLGPPPPAPPPHDWLPPAAARVARALDTYVRMFDIDATAEPVPVTAAELHGLAASPGRCTGTARVIQSPADFDRIEPGDVLVARITTQAYNLLLPLVAAIVTDRGGLLSHPAIVAREYGIPGVVGTREATRLIPDGARVEVDGDTGIVRVLS